RTHQERREHERVLVEEQAPRTHHARAVGEAVAIAVEVQEHADLIIPAEDAFDVVAAVLLDRWCERAMPFPYEHAEAAACRLHDRRRFDLDDVIAGVAQIARGALDQGDDAGMHRIAMPIARDRNADRRRQRHAVERYWHPPRITRIVLRHHA